MNKVFIVLLAGFSAGILMCSFLNLGWDFAIFFILLGLVLAGLFFSQRLIGLWPNYHNKIIFLFSLFFLALSMGIIRYEIKEAKSAGLENQIGAKVVFQGVIIDEPDEKENYTRLVIEEDKTKNNILVVSRRYPVFRYGDKIEVSGVIKKPEKSENSDFDWPAYLAKDDIYFEMIYPQVKFISGSGGFWLQRRLFDIKAKFIANDSNTL